MRKGAPQVNRICRQCSAVETPLWRAGPAGPKTLCNACGVRWKKGKLVLNECAQGLKPINDAEVAASLTRAASAKAKSPVGTSRKRGGRQTQSNPPVNRRTKATPMEKSPQDGPKETKPSPPSFWTSPASSPVSKEPSPVPEEEGKKLVESEPASVDLSCALEHFQLADDNLERCGSEMLDDMDDFNQKIGAQAYIDPMSTIPISPATSSICPESPPSSILTSPLSSDNGKDSLNKLRSAVYDPQNSIAKPYKECVMQLGQLCMNLSTEERTKYVRAFANDQCLTLNPCGLSIAEIQRHDIVLEGFFRNEVAFGHALCAYREAYSSLELLDFGSNAFVDMLVEDVSRVVPALQRSNMKLVAAE